MRGTVFHPLPPARGFRQHGVAAGQPLAGHGGQEPLGLPKRQFFLPKCRGRRESLIETRLSEE
jgi:hypothetical protein